MSKLLERQTKALDKQQDKLTESIKRWGFDAKAIPFGEDGFSIKSLKENAVHLCETKQSLREANSETVFGALLRYGVQNFMFDAYKSVDDFVYTDYVRMRTSKNRQEWYAPLFGVEIPQDVPLGGKYEDSRIAGLDVEVINKKVGRILSFERELVDDDQTDQISQKSGELGSRMRYKEEADVNGVDVFTLAPQGRGITGVANTSYSTALGNKGTFGPLSQPLIEAADILAHNMVDPLNNRIMVKPSILLVSPADKFNAAKLLNSALQPSVPGAAGTQTANTATSGLTGWTMTMNPLQGLYNLKVSRFLPSGYWYLIDPQSTVFQDRDPLELLMEAHDGGTSFERDQYRWRVRRRYQVATLEYRYIIAGNGI
jgi:hypothetical protein